MISTVDHVAAAQARLRQQYKNRPKLSALMAALIGEINTLEQVFYGMYTNRSLQQATGFTLDLWGQLLNVLRGGMSDSLYRVQLYAQIGENMSSGTPDDVAGVYNLLMQSRYTQVVENSPAGLSLTAVGANPVGTMANIKAAVLKATAAGVSIDTYLTTNNVPFVFLGDSDPLGQGFGNLYDATVGGYPADLV